ncbi:hypothetical protein Bcav_4113 [Beutenbergia cavernae DSM 12333]|uniref:DUF4436 domain-containing protein n=1 Tax=Beutenbergia cavernae (strain ATCC BAA-8 / DSM 12333 / CCUG 43141 / JCM 11478 / NBRC 16432 / NCIMB 13614 / HKI 0122) TaxID=471853 RepID=C5C5Z5_BEUC1|nr:DUF4436 family protein [Beutenbergia cavernae]ACQ82353.1 hypothetical protein Bcav_4113 [Beutenbergia cavernae DSM 12333]
MTQQVDEMVPDDVVAAERRRRRKNPAPRILAVVGALLVVYYAVVAFSGALNVTTEVPIQGEQPVTGEDYLTLQMKTEDVDLTNRVLSANILPIPHGDFVGDRAGEMSENLRIEIVSGGMTTSVVTYPGESIVDPTTVTLVLDRGDTFYPWDRPFSDFRVSVQDDETGENVPFELTIENSARPWVMSATLGEVTTENGIDTLPVTLDGNRDALSVTLVVFYLLAILLTTLMAVVTIGSALLKKKLEFSNVIWLSATMLSFPALRSAMPGAPPIGTALDFIVLFPCICIVAAMLVWTGAHLLWRESKILRGRELDDDDAAASAAAGAAASDD